MKALHPKIKELQLRVKPITYSGSRAMVQYADDAAAPEDQPIDFKVSITDRQVKGYLAVWGIEDTYGTIFLKGSCTKSINERGPASASKQKIAFLWMHDQCDPMGQFTTLKEDDYGLYFEATLDDVPTGERALRQITSGTLNQFSIGFDYLWDRVEYDEDLDAVIIKECILMEGSVVTFGSNPETYAMRSTEQLASDKEQLMDETNEFIRTLPMSKRLELRQLITRHISLAEALKPSPDKEHTPENSSPMEDLVKNWIK